ncbi:uncharacterized protein LOC111319200 [Stylophora pistillata]|uniref:uncharacterized protein LOC111319200 n=1 Tax=Stylophora pistillata TaxID=50429 RepID=UPI000C054D00|nr:uncharacterized protein LOC111319200 [Stylophora pistillata]
MSQLVVEDDEESDYMPPPLGREHFSLEALNRNISMLTDGRVSQIRFQLTRPLVECAKSTQVYADDTSLTFASTDVEHINYCLNHDLSNVYEWLSANKLTLNMTKTEFMLIASNQKLSQFTESPSLFINENAIEQVTSAKSLGVYVDQNINWKCHIENISKKIACAIRAIKRIRHLTPFNVLIKVYNNLIQPHFDYCNVVWGNCNKGLSEKLQRLQKRPTRILMTPDYLRSRFVYRDSVSAYRLRNTENKLVLPQPRTDYLKRSFLYSGVQLWKNLPIDLRQASSLTDFKSKLSLHSLNVDRHVYLMDEQHC